MKRIFISVMALALMASCAKKAVETPPADRVEIKVASQVLEIESKIPYDGQIGDGNELTARVLASTAAGNYQTDNLLAGGDGTITFTDNDQTARGFDKTPVYFPYGSPASIRQAAYGRFPRMAPPPPRRSTARPT